MKKKLLKILFKILGGVIVFIIGYFFYQTIAENWDKLRGYDFSYEILPILLSVLIILISVIYLGFIWREILYSLTKKMLDPLKMIKIQLNSWLCKYIPGKLGTALMKVYLGNKEGFSKKELFISTVYENILVILSNFIVGIPIVLIFFEKFSSNQQYLILLIGVGCIFVIILLTTRLLPFLIRIFFKIIKRGEIDNKYFLKKQKVGLILMLYIINIFVFGFSLFLVITGFIDINWWHVFYVISAFAFANLIGILTVFVPAGLGVREGVLSLFLANIMPLEIAIIISIVSRLWLALIDLIIVFLISAFKIKDFAAVKVEKGN